MVMPRRYGNANTGSTMRYGLDLLSADEYLAAVDNGERIDAFARALAAMERGRPSWHRDAPCIGSEVDFTSKAKTDRAAALAICGGCPVMLQCRDWAVRIDDNVAVLGGMDPAARRQYAKRAAS